MCVQQSTKNCIREATETAVLVHLVSRRYVSQVARIAGHAGIVHGGNHSGVASERISTIVPSAGRISVATERSHGGTREHSVVREVVVHRSFLVAENRSFSFGTTIVEFGEPNRA